MSKRLQVLLSDAELEAIRREAAAHGLTVSAWVREVLRHAREHSASGHVADKLAAVRAAARHCYPTADIDQMLADIESGYTSP